MSALLKSYREKPNFSRVSGDIFVDVALEFKLHPVTKDVTSKTGTSAIAQSLRNICLTNPGDIDEEPDFGVGVFGLLGENQTPVAILALKDRIYAQCEKYEPRAELTEVLVDYQLSEYTVRIRIIYVPVNVDTEEEVTIEVSRSL